MKNPPTPDPKPGEPGHPPDHNPKDDPLPVDPGRKARLAAMDNAFLHGRNNLSK